MVRGAVCNEEGQEQHLIWRPAPSPRTQKLTDTTENNTFQHLHWQAVVNEHVCLPTQLLLTVGLFLVRRNVQCNW